MYIRETIRVIDGLDIPADAREQIYHRNIRRLLKQGTAAEALCAGAQPVAAPSPDQSSFG